MFGLHCVREVCAPPYSTAFGSWWGFHGLRGLTDSWVSRVKIWIQAYLVAFVRKSHCMKQLMQYISFNIYSCCMHDYFYVSFKLNFLNRKHASRSPSSEFFELESILTSCQLPRSSSTPRSNEMNLWLLRNRIWKRVYHFNVCRSKIRSTLWYPFFHMEKSSLGHLDSMPFDDATNIAYDILPNTTTNRRVLLIRQKGWPYSYSHYS
jgi:hypothetical protein